jgi:hypothetical protein
MALQKLQFRAGVNREGTNYSNEGGWYLCDKVRFRSGYPEKIGGWTNFLSNYSTFLGVCRSLVNWIDLSSNNNVGIGTNLKYYINPNQTSYYDITPVRGTAHTLSSSPFTTFLTSPQLIQINDTTHGAQVGDFVTIAGLTSATVNGIPGTAINAQFQIINVIDSNNYQIQVSALYAATSSGTPTVTGTITATYQISVGLPAAVVGNGFGAGVWNGVNYSSYYTTLAYSSPLTTGLELLNNTATTISVASTAGFPSSGTIIIDAEVITYSGTTSTSFTGCTRGTNGSTAVWHGYRPYAPGTTPTPVTVYGVLGYLGSTAWGAGTSGAASGVSQQLLLWTADNFGQDLIIAPRGGAIYYWTNTNAYNPAVQLSTTSPVYAPTATNQVLISDVSEFVIALGSNPYGTSTYNPMNVRWSDQGNPQVWQPLATNQAGGQTLSNGSYIMCGRKNRQEIVIWTDSALYSMQYIGPPFVWGFYLMMSNISIISPNAAIVVNNVAYWMGIDKFYQYTGTVQTLPCSLRQFVFDDISYDQRFQVTAGVNEGYNEVWWYYVSNTAVAAAASAGTTPLIDRYVVFNYLENTWYYGNLQRTSWLGTHLLQYPLASYVVQPFSQLSGAITSSATTITISNATQFATSGIIIIDSEYISYNGINGNSFLGCIRGVNGTVAASHANGATVTQFNSLNSSLVFHEDGTDDNSAPTPVPFSCFVTTSDFDIQDGDHFSYIWRIVPDVNFNGSNSGFPAAYIQVQARNFPGNPYQPTTQESVNSNVQYTPVIRQYDVQQYTQQIYTRLRGRQMNFTIGSGGQLGVAWQLGSPRIDTRTDGRR